MKIRFRPLARRLFFVLAALSTLIALFYAEEDWRGARALAAERSVLQARGESVDLQYFIPPPIPDDQNLAMAPLFVRLFRYQVDPATKRLVLGLGPIYLESDTYKEVAEMPWGKDTRGSPARPGNQGAWLNQGSWTTGHETDFAEIEQYFRQCTDFPRLHLPQTPAADVLLALTRYAPLLDELAQDSGARPQTRFPLQWTHRPAWSISLPQYAVIEQFTRTLSLRASAELAQGQQTAAALRDIALMFRLRQFMENDPVLIAALVDANHINLLLQPVWEGLKARLWSAQDLEQLQSGLTGINILREYQQGIAGGERAMFFAHFADEMQNAARAGEFAGFFEPSAPGPEKWLWRLLSNIPRGWYWQNVATVYRFQQEYLLDPVDPASHRIALARCKDFAPALAALPPGPSTFIARVSLAAFTSVILRFAQSQTAIDQAATACALEKYYLDHDTYPPTLDALVPVYLARLPHDVIDGAPMRYRLTDDGRYQLYSIGWDGLDGGGNIEWPTDRTWRQATSHPAGKRKEKFPSPLRDKGDWVWQYAPADPPDPPVNTSRLGSWVQSSP